MQNALIVAQVVVSMVLLVGAGLLLASFYRSQTVDPGYRANHVLSAEAFTNFSKYPDSAHNCASISRSSRCSPPSRCSDDGRHYRRHRDVGVAADSGIRRTDCAGRQPGAYLFDTAPTDPATFVAVAVSFVLAAAVACAGPAWRATTVDSMQALRAD